MKRQIKTDGDVVRMARRMQELQQNLFGLLADIRESEHPNAERIADALDEQCIFYAWPTHVIDEYLEHPEEWEVGDWGIRHAAATRAATKREARP